MGYDVPTFESSIISGASGVAIRAGDRWVRNYGLGDGHAVVFDDSFEHEVRHDGAEDRYALLAVLHNPRDQTVPQTPPEDASCS